MTRSVIMSGWALVAFGLQGCTSGPEIPLVFAQSDTFGMSVSGSVTNRAAEITLGYRGNNVAIVPGRCSS